MATSARSRRATFEEPPAPPAQSGGSLNGLLLLLTALLGACCAYLLLEWAPEDHANIGNVASQDYLSYGPIDVVYTWVNGTDPRWKTEKEFWHKHWIASLTGQPLPVWGEEPVAIKGKDDSNSDNRFRDNEELRYSLRSLEKYAPWIRHIYVVTDGQIPSWLDIESPKLSIVKHREIFANQSHLPVFSSPAIEWSLDNIPGLSDMFLYFNDDVFLGAPVRPEDFVSQAGVQKAYFAWEIPLCANRCWETSLGNGRCDKECNVTACDFDLGDCGCDVDPHDGALSCDADKIASIQEHAPKPPRIGDHLCQGTCQYQWLGNGFCDRTCNVSSCAFDGGDCRVRKPVERHSRHNRHKQQEQEQEEEGMSPLVLDLWSADVVNNHTIVKMPVDVNATYLDLTQAFGGANGSIVSAAHDNERLVRFAAVYEDEMVLLLVFGRDVDVHPMTSSVQISVKGKTAQGASIQLDFSLVRGKKFMETAAIDVEEPNQEEEASNWIAGGASSFQNTSIRPSHIRLPFGFRQATFQTVEPRSIKETPAEIGETVDADDSSSSVEDEEKLVTQAIEEEKPTSALVADSVPQIEVFLPFNVTGKKLDDGDVLNLGWYLELRLHDDVEDLKWNDHQICRLRLPKKKKAAVPVDGEVESIAVTADSEIEASESTDQAQIEVEVAAASSDPVEHGGDVKTFGFDALQDEQLKPQDIHLEVPEESEEAAEDDEESDEIPACRLVEDQRGIIVTLRVPTHYARAVLSSTEAGEQEEEAQDAHIPSSSSPSPSQAASQKQDDEGDEGEVEMETRPQVVDGQLCFYDSDRADPSRYRYCFALAMAHFHSYEVEAVHKPTLYALLHPPKPAVVYTPYSGDDPALLELIDRCIDTTRRLAGIRPRLCYRHEVPIPRSRDGSATVEPDPQALKEAEGRRLACEARRRRLSQREEAEEEAEASSGAFSQLRRAFAGLKTAMGFSTVESADENLEDVEYHDVCDSTNPPEAENEPPKKPEVSLKNAQALLSKDTFGDSLRFVNKLYNRAFGKAAERRRVPSHMPFLLQKALIREIKEHWTVETQATSAHRFRHPEDMQFSFSYFHYALNRAKIHPHTLEEIWREYLDANRNGILDENELLTAASLAHGDAPPEDFVTEVRECIQPPKREKVRELPAADGTLRLSETLTPYVTLENLEQCASVRDALLRNVRHEPMVELMTESEVTFHMLSDNYAFAWKQMLGTRARRTKFVCINDDMKHPSTAVSQILHELFLSIWPKRSQFELPYHLKNRYAHIDEYNAAQTRRQLAVAFGVVLLLLLALVFRAELRALFGFQDIARARAASASQLSHAYHKQEEEAQGEPADGGEATSVSSNARSRKASD
ncbi:hypothetical protein BBJ28_00002343 [Nothophytophthora sp. Chile5]|nr:hypothetical protein BBJ28_00002343 [Nothophytophthora sp. Chile5]